MTISATERRELRGLALDVFGERGADLLMAGLAGSDLEAMEERLNLRIELSSAEMKTQMAALRGEFGELRGEFGELRGELGELKGEFGELKGEFGELKGYVGDQLGGIRAEISNQNRLFFVAVVTMVLGIVGLLFTAYQLGAG
jgi:HAMP domain-containing protein